MKIFDIQWKSGLILNTIEISVQVWLLRSFKSKFNFLWAINPDKFT